MIVVSETQTQAEEISWWIADALRYNRLLAARDADQHIPEANESAQNLYDRLSGYSYEVALTELRKLYLSPSGLTVRWDEPRQIPRGPYAGSWYIACPMRDGEIREEWVYQIDPLTEEPRERSVWAGAEIVKRDPSWFDTSIDINTADTTTLQTLSGVGASLAQAIIDGRPWADPADLSQISGISAAMVEGWQDDPGLSV